MFVTNKNHINIMIVELLLCWYGFLISEKMEVPKDEIFPWVFPTQLGIGAFSFGIWNFDCHISSVGYHCDSALLPSDWSRVCLLLSSSWAKILMKKENEL